MAASSENLAASIDPLFLLRQSSFDYCWPTPQQEHETLTKALQQTVFGDQDDFNLLFLTPQQPEPERYQIENRSFSPFSSPDPEQHHQQLTNSTPSARSASDQEAATASKRRTVAVGGKARITKRKSRATKKNQTTFITADPANFRQMVQQVTGVRFDASSSSSSSSPLPPLSHLLEPETRRPVGRFYNLCLPTLDTSSYLLDRQSQSLISDRPNYSAAGGLTSFGAAQSADGDAGFGASDGLSCFPTLESWKVM